MGNVAWQACYAKRVIKSFLDEETRQLFLTGRSRRFRAVERQTARRLGLLEFAKRLEDLRERLLETSSARAADQHSIRVSEQHRVCFRWQDGEAWDVKVVTDDQ